METTWKDIIENTWELFHVGLIVRDVDKTLEYYQSLGLVSSFLEVPTGHRVPRTFKVLTKAGDVPHLPSKVRIFRMGPLPIEMVQPAEGSRNANSEFLASKGDGVAHFCFFVDDLEAETAKLVEKGIQVIFSETQQNRVTMRYFDTRKFGGIVLELKLKGTGAYGIEAAIDTARELVAQDKKYFMPDQFSNPANPLAHYETTGAEIINDFPYDKIDVLIAGIGTGGTIVGISQRLKERYPNIRAISVEPPPDDSIQGLKCLGEEVPPFWDLSLAIERAIVTSQQAAVVTRQLLDKEGIFAGLSSGAVVHQAIKVAKELEEGNIVVVLADAGWKYLSLGFWTKAE